MADTQTPMVPTDINGTTSNPGSNFLDATPVLSETVKVKDVLYNDFFQENSSGELTIGSKKERSGLEIFVSGMQYVTIFVVATVVLFGLHVFIRSSQSGSFFENYTFLCPYLHYDILSPEDEK